MIIFLDESGDLGFDWNKPKTSPYFTITILVCENKEVQRSFRQAVKRTLKNKVNRRKRKHPAHELKGESTSLAVKSYFYKNVPQSGWALYAVVLNKSRVLPELQTKQGKKKLYNFLARFILEKVDFSRGIETVTLIVDRCKNTEEIRDFNRYMQNQLEALLPLETRLYIDHETSQENHGLQAVDLFCWGIARKATKDDREWYSLYADKIRFETVYLPGK